MSRGPDAGTLLLRALVQHAGASGCAVTIVESDWSRWSSATFSGARHDIVIESATGAVFDDWLAVLPETELTGRTALVADVSVTRIERLTETTRARIEALTVDL